MLSLGMWQLDRAEFKSNLESIIEYKKDNAKTQLKLNIFSNQEWIYTPVSASGYFDNSVLIYLDNQVHNMQAGFTVYSPFMIHDNTAILVDRGWLPIEGDRNHLPGLDQFQTQLSVIEGMLITQPAKGLVLSDSVHQYTHWPATLQYVDVEEISGNLPYKLLPGILKLDESNNEMLSILPVKSSFNSAKHQAYAFQWFALSLALLMIYIIVNTKRQPKSE